MPARAKGCAEGSVMAVFFSCELIFVILVAYLCAVGFVRLLRAMTALMSNG